MSMQRSSLSVIYVDPETEPVSEPIPEPQDPGRPETPKRRGRPPGSKNKKNSSAVKRSIPWFTVWRSAFWAAVGVISVVSLYRGVDGWLGQSAAYIVLAVSVLVAAFLLDRDWKKMRSPRE